MITDKIIFNEMIAIIIIFNIMFFNKMNIHNIIFYSLKQNKRRLPS